MSEIVVLILRIILLASLYSFLGWAIFTIWRELHIEGHALATPRIPALSLTPLVGELDGIQTFSAPEIVIGRSTAAELPITNDTVSSRHARLSFHHNQWWLEDLNSTNGTFLNDERVSTPTVIVSGDELRVGQVSLLIAIQDKGE
jgi:pSer/pThr/pTyr-binding forkhead associated (FHA) protein